MSLTSARFAGVDRLERCRAGETAARLTPGTSGDFVALVQQALMDLGEPLPRFGADGSYGTETTTAVLNYKTRHGLKSPDGSIDGIVGPGTMGALDEECTARDETPGPCPPDSTGPVVDLAGADEQLVNMVLARTTAATAIGVDAVGATRLVGTDLKLTEPLAASLAGSSARMLVDDPRAGEAAAQLSADLAELAAAFAAGGFGPFADAAAEGAQWAATVVPGLQLAAALAAALGGTQPSPTTPVRDLSKTAALAEAVAHAQAGRLTLTPGPVTKPDGTVTMPDPKAKFTISPTVAGVTYKFTNFGDRRRANYQPAAAPLAGMDIRHVVGVIRHAMHMSARWGVTEIHHVGIGTNGVPDCHGDGRACDFVGAAGVRGGTPFLLTVFNDWKNNSVPNLDDRTKPRRPDWPPVTRTLEYRLATLPGADPLARDFFADLYAWVAREYQDRTDGPGQTLPASAIGEGSRIMTPDHPDSKPGTKNGREAHHSHVHWQVGPTGRQAP